MQTRHIHRFSQPHLGLLAGCAAIALMSTMLSQAALAEPTGYNQISYSVNASKEVKNDQVTATLTKQAQADSPKLLATELNSAMNQALQIAKRYPSVTATTGSQNTYPRHNNDDGKILGWTGSASLDLKSNDFTAMSDLVAALQDTLVLQNIQFGISKDKRAAVEQELMIEASQAFKDQANVLTKAWDNSGYQIVSVTLNTEGGYTVQPMMAMRSTMNDAAGVPAQNFEGGDSEVKVVANGTIELLPWRK